MNYAFLFLNLFLFSSIEAISHITLPNPTGQYHVGTENILLKDENRTMTRRLVPRRWMLTLYYPGVPSQENSLYTPVTSN